MAETLTTTMSRRWLVKIAIFLIGLPMLGLWGLYDATIKYPKRGQEDSSQRLRNYLLAADANGALSQVGISNPALELDDLTTRGERGQLTELELARLDWLLSLKRGWTLESPTHKLRFGGRDQPTTIKYWDTGKGQAYPRGSGEPQYEVTRDTLRELDARWTSTQAPEPLSGFDLATQWLITAVGFGGALYPLYLLLRVGRTRFKWQPDEQRLTVPGGDSFVPSDIEDFDKRKWHKFYVTVILTDGRTHTFDLLRFHPLEDWILEMERTRFPERAEDEVDDDSDDTTDDHDEPEAGTPESDKETTTD